MIENAIHIPLNDNEGSSIQSVVDATIQSILETFGGCTTYHARGLWVDNEGNVYDEPVMRVLVATDKPELLRVIAKNLRVAAKQVCVYVVVDGKAEFI